MVEKDYSCIILDLISKIIKNNKDIEWQTCSKCGREFPLNTKFFEWRNRRKINNGFSKSCRECYNDVFTRKSIKTEADIINIYNNSIINNKKLGNNFWNKDSMKYIIRYIILDIHKFSKDDIYDKVTNKFLHKNKIFYNNIFNSLFETLEYCFPEYKLLPWLIESPWYYWKDENNIKYGLDWLIRQLFSDGIIKTIDEIPKYVTIKLIVEKYKLYGLIEQFNKNLYKIFNYLYPGKWEEWDFPFIAKGYFKDINNVKYAINKVFIEKLNYNKDDFLNITVSDLEKNNLLTILNYHRPLTKCIIECFPEFNIFEWEFNRTTGYWKTKNNRIKAFKQLVEEKLLLDINNIPQIVTNCFLKNNYPKFSWILDEYYQSNIYNWVNEVYPNKFIINDFSSLVTSDGFLVGSKEEMLLHEFMISNYNNDIKYVGNKRGNKYKWCNKKEKENYYVDWIVDCNIIIEYFGLYKPKRLEDHILEYVAKTHRKIVFFTDYCINNHWSFIALFPEDLKYNLQGVKDKLNIILN